MDKRRMRRKAVDLVQNLLILLLTCSALWMIGAGSLWNSIRDTGEESPRLNGLHSTVSGSGESIRPTRITLTLSGGEQPGRRVIQYDDASVDTLFRQTAGILMETLSSVEEPRRISRESWQRGLQQAPGLCFDFQGELPLSVLCGWLGIECVLPDCGVRRLLLTVWDDTVALYYHDRTEESWYRCTTQVVSAGQLESVFSGLSENDAYYAFESERTAVMDPDTVLVPDPGKLTVCRTENPVSGGRASLEELLVGLNFHLSGSVFYSAADEEVARIGSDTVRLSKSGVLEYDAGGVGEQFPVARLPGESEVFAAAEACRQVLLSTAAQRCGQARFYLSRVEQTAEGFRIEFQYCVNAVPVQLGAGPAAVFEVGEGHITAFTLYLRRYELSGETQLVLPPVQAAAAMDALSLTGQELQIMYRDVGEDTALPMWVAVDAG